MVCNLVTYRARSAVREVGYALGFPRPLVDRVAKALETYDSVMVRRDLEADGGFAEFFRAAGGGAAGRGSGGRGGRGAWARRRDGPAEQRVPLVGKVPPWRQPPKPVDPDGRDRSPGFARGRRPIVATEAAGPASSPPSARGSPPRPVRLVAESRSARDAEVRSGGRLDPAQAVNRAPRLRAGRSARDSTSTRRSRGIGDPRRPGRPGRARSTLAASRIEPHAPSQASNGRLPGFVPPIPLVGVESGRRTGQSRSATIRWRRGRRSGAGARPGTRVGPATRRRASRGCGPVGARGMPRSGSGSCRRRSSMAGRSIPRAARSSRRRGRTDRLGRPNSLGPAGPAGPALGRGGTGAATTTARSRGDRARGSRRRPAAARRSGSATGSAGSSSAPGSMASRAISRSTAAACS